MKNFPGVEDEPQEPTEAAPEAQETPVEATEAPTDSMTVAGKFQAEHAYEMFAPSGFVHRGDLDALLGSEITDELYFFIADNVMEYTAQVLNPVISPYIFALEARYHALKRASLTEEEDDKPTIVHLDEIPPGDLGEFIKQMFEQAVKNKSDEED